MKWEACDPLGDRLELATTITLKAASAHEARLLGAIARVLRDGGHIEATPLNEPMIRGTWAPGKSHTRATR